MIELAATRPLGWAALALSFAVAAGAGSHAIAQAFPSNVIRIVVPGSAGTPPDTISRLIATELTESDGWNVVVENRPGAIQTIAGSEILKSPADGYSIFALSVPGSAAPALLPNVPFRLEADFAPVIKVSTSYNVLVVNPSVPAKSLAELVTLLKSQPDKLNFSSGGFGTPAHLIGEMFKVQTNVRAAPCALSDVSPGHCRFAQRNQSVHVRHDPAGDRLIASGKLRALAVTGPKRVAALPNVPTVVEQGFPNLVVEDWVGFAVKNGTPSDIVAKLNVAINNALAKPIIRDAFVKLGAEPAGGAPSEFGNLLKLQIAQWGQVVKESGIKMPR
jgi:tripartite-type tricarboxylate transporter receptor subunit TctC